MKTILRILVILIVAGIISFGTYSLVESTSLASGLGPEHGEPPTIFASTGQSFEPMERPEGGEHSASLAAGLPGLFGTFAKITIITILVVLLQKGFYLLRNRKSRLAPN